MGVMRTQPARVTDWAARSVGAAWRAFDLQLTTYAVLLLAVGLGSLSIGCAVAYDVLHSLVFPKVQAVSVRVNEPLEPGEPEQPEVAPVVLERDGD